MANNLILLGLPGAGKGTVSELLCSTLRIPRISTGDIFRSAVISGSSLGVAIKATLETGSLVNNSIATNVVKERLNEEDINDGFLLDGFPRTIDQANSLEKICDLQAVINIVITEELALRRISGRRVCINDGENFHLEYQPPRKSGVCDKCGQALTQRDDDRPATAYKRFQVYKTQTQPLIEFYSNRGLLLGIDGSLKPEYVRDNILSLLQ